jgi:hypothetical protein
MFPSGESTRSFNAQKAIQKALLAALSFYTEQKVEAGKSWWSGIPYPSKDAQAIGIDMRRDQVLEDLGQALGRRRSTN